MARKDDDEIWVRAPRGAPGPFSPFDASLIAEGEKMLPATMDDERGVRRRSAGGGSRSRAFTLIELVTVVVVLGVLIAVALPAFLDYREDARRAAEQGVVGAVRSAIRAAGIRTALTGDVTWPAALDAAAANSTASPANPFFSNILSSPIVSDWRKGSSANQYVGPQGTSYDYDATDGSFKTAGSGTSTPEIPGGGGTQPPPVSPFMMTPEEVQDLDPSEIAGAGLTPEQIAWLTPAQLAGLSADDLARLSDEQLRALTAIQIAALTYDQFGAVVARLSPAQIASASP